MSFGAHGSSDRALRRGTVSAVFPRARFVGHAGRPVLLSECANKSTKADGVRFVGLMRGNELRACGARFFRKCHSCACSRTLSVESPRPGRRARQACKTR
jgi:hypothetical protein